MTTNFNFSFGTLTQRADRVDSLMHRDAREFASIGYDENFRTNLKDLTQVFRQLPSDDYWLGQQMLKTETKRALQTKLLDVISNLRFRAKLALGEQSVEYRSLRFGKLQTMKEQDLILFAGHVSSSCRAMMEKLAKRNITEEMLTEIDTTATALDDAIDEQRRLISMREAKAFEREERANEIYSQIAEICEVGKKIWEGKNNAHYNDYVIYGSKETTEEDEEVVEETKIE